MPVVSEKEGLESLEALGMDVNGTLEEVSREELKESGVIVYLGVLAAKSLYNYGTAVFCLDDSGKVVQANPIHVYLGPEAIVQDNQKDVLWIRPIIGNGTPKYAAWRDGVLWEVQKTNEEGNGTD